MVAMAVLGLLLGGCAAVKKKKYVDPDAPTAAELRSEYTRVEYLSHDRVMNERARLDEPVPPGGRVVVKIRRATPRRGEFDSVTIIVVDGRGETVLRQNGRREAALMCGVENWCAEQYFDIPTPVEGPLQITVLDGRTGERERFEVELTADE